MVGLLMFDERFVNLLAEKSLQFCVTNSRLEKFIQLWVPKDGVDTVPVKIEVTPLDIRAWVADHKTKIKEDAFYWHEMIVFTVCAHLVRLDPTRQGWS